jgi:hypothetical protein
MHRADFSLLQLLCNDGVRRTNTNLHLHNNLIVMLRFSQMAQLPQSFRALHDVPVQAVENLRNTLYSLVDLRFNHI